MKAPRSRQEATSGAVPLSKRGRLQRAARLVEGVAQALRRRPGGWRRRGPRRAPGRAPCGRRRRRRSGRGRRRRPPRRAARGRRSRGGRRPPGRRRRRGRVRAPPTAAPGCVEREDEHRRLLADPERLQPPAQLGRLHPPAERPGEDVAGEPPLGLAGDPAPHQLQRHHRDRLLQDQPLEVAEPAGVADDHHPGLRRPAARRDHRVGQRPPRDRGVGGDEGVAVAGVAERFLADRRRSRRRRAGGGSRARRAARRGRRGPRRCRRRRRRSSRRFPPGRAPRGPAARAAAAPRSPAAAPRTAR